MNKLFRRVAVSVATGSMIFGSFMPAALGQLNLEVTGNGSDSNNTLNLSSTNSTVVTQSNTANISNNVNVSADTGGNDAEDNTGGDVSVTTGDSDVSVGISNTANSNSASVDSCNGCLGDLSVVISGNGSDSDNEVNLDVENTTHLTQSNYANVNNNVDIDSNTGDNDANDNTGGDVEVNTGSATTSVEVNNLLNANVASVSSGEEEGDGLSIWITGNGSDSDNTVNLGLESATVVTQANVANVNNDVDVDSDTGDNDAEDNTGGDVMIDTGDADVDVTVDTMANFNLADIMSCCLLSGTAKISGNGSDSENELNAEVLSAVFGTQANDYSCDGQNESWFPTLLGGKDSSDNCNDVDVDSDTGDNDANDNTQFEGDPSVETGDAGATVGLSTTANANALTIGEDVLDDSMDFPDWDDLNHDGFLGWWAWIN